MEVLSNEYDARKRGDGYVCFLDFGDISTGACIYLNSSNYMH